jgi:hypothetical protein
MEPMGVPPCLATERRKEEHAECYRQGEEIRTSK